MASEVGQTVFFRESFLDPHLKIVARLEDDLPAPIPELAARYAAMTDEDLMAELWLLAGERRIQ